MRKEVKKYKGARVQESRIIAFLLLYFCTLLPSYSYATVLSDAAAKLSPGQWATVPMSNVNLTAKTSQPGAAWSSDSDPGGFYNGPQPGWDSTGRKLYIEITDHSTSSTSGDCEALGVLTTFPTVPQTCFRPIWKYDDATDTWTVDGPFPKRPSGTGVSSGHTWGFVAWNDTDKVMYIREFISYDTNQPIFRYCANATPSYCATQGANTWAQFNGPSILHQAGADVSMAWHATLNGGTLLYFGSAAGGKTGCGALLGYREGVGWSTIDAGTGCKFAVSVGDSGDLGNMYMIPSPVKGLVMFPAGGGAPWWKIDGAGTITRLDNHPTGCRFGTTNGIVSQGAVDPVSGDAYFIGCTPGGQLWRLNPTATAGSQWTLISSGLAICTPSRFPTENCGADFYMTPISTYGVIGAIRFRRAVPNTAEYYIYKATASSGDTTPPVVSMTAPTGGATVSTSVTLSATASDDIGVVGVQFKVDGTNVGSEDTASPYSISWDSTTVTNGTHSITAVARDAAGNGTTSSAVSVTVSNAGGGADFATRCTAPGVIRCVGFDSSADVPIANYGVKGLTNDGTTMAVLDTAVKASGNSSLKFTIPIIATNGPNNSGNYFLNFSDDFRTVFPCHGESWGGTTCVQAGNGNDYYIQFRARFDPYYITNQYSGGGWKLAWIGNVADKPGCREIDAASTGLCSSSCTDLELVMQNTFHYNVGPLGYYACPGHHYETDFYRLNYPNPGDINFQNEMPSPYCLYPPATAKNCFRWQPNEWMTFQAHIHVDNPRTFVDSRCGGVLCRDYPSSYIEIWAAREGQPSQLVTSKSFPIWAGTNASDQRYGKIWLTAYDSGRCMDPDPPCDTPDATQVSYVWFDEVIISDRKIADPSTGTTPHVFVPASFRIQ